MITSQSRRRGLGMLLAALLVAGLAQAAHFQIARILGRVPVPPTPVMSEGKTALAYELWLTSLEQEPIRITKVQVFAGSGTEAWLTLAGDDVDKAAKFFGATEEMEAGPYTDDEGATGTTATATGLAAGSTVMLMLWVEVPEGEYAPESLSHTVTYQKSDGTERVVEGIVTPVSSRSAPVLGPPMKDGTWVMANGPDSRWHHWSAVFATDGTPRISQRFAADWMKLNEDGKLFAGDGKTNEDFYCYGEDLVAMADGTVIVARDGLEDILPWHDPESDAWETPNDIGGNHVILDVGGGVYVFYAHMQKNSIVVKAGDKVKKGDLLGKLGNSGNTDAPHLHLHVMSALPEALSAVGLPYALTAYEHLGTWDTLFDDLDNDKGYDLAGATAVPYTDDLPRANAVIRFSEDTAETYVGFDAIFDPASGRLLTRSVLVDEGYVDAAFVLADGLFVLDTVLAKPAVYPRDGADWDRETQTVTLPRVLVEEAVYRVVLKKLEADGLVFALQSVDEVE